MKSCWPLGDLLLLWLWNDWRTFYLCTVAPESSLDNNYSKWSFSIYDVCDNSKWRTYGGLPEPWTGNGSPASSRQPVLPEPGNGSSASGGQSGIPEPGNGTGTGSQSPGGQSIIGANQEHEKHLKFIEGSYPSNKHGVYCLATLTFPTYLNSV